MPELSTIDIELSSGDKTTNARVEQRLWTKNDARGKALEWGGGIFIVCLVMLPIPLVHFAIIPVLFVGLPVTLFMVFKMYSQGTDIRGEASCPACGAKIKLLKSLDDWPLVSNCPSCRVSLSIERKPT